MGKMSHVIGNPIAAVVPAGVCYFGEDFSPAPLVSKVPINSKTAVYTFGLDGDKALGLSTCACILAKGGQDKDGKPVVRPYTPISTNEMIGKFQLMVKTYPGQGLSAHMATMKVGDVLEFKHIPFNVKEQFPFKAKTICMLVGGTGIAPMIQALHAILGTEGNSTHVKMIYANRTEQDILAKDTVDAWAAASGGRFSVTYILTRDKRDHAYEKGYINAGLITSKFPPPSDDVQIWVCGTPVFYDDISGPRGEPEVGGVLAEIGYSTHQVVKF